jgi:hypothetical protein
MALLRRAMRLHRRDMDASISPRRRGTGRRSSTVAAAALACIAALTVVAPAQAGSAPTSSRRGVAREVTSIPTSEFGIARPGGLAYLPGGQRLLVAARAAGGTQVVRTSLLGDAHGSFRLPRVRRLGTLAFDPRARVLTALSGDRKLSVEASTLAQRRPQVGRSDVAPFARAPRAATFDPSTGDWYVLSGNGIVKISPSGTRSRIDLRSLGSLKAIAFNARDGLVYVTGKTGTTLVGVDADGTIRRTYRMASVRLRDVRSMVFAPTADGTDPAGRVDLYVADAGDGTTLGRVAEVRLGSAAAPIALAAPTETATLIQTIHTSAWVPASPDPSGIVFLSGKNRFEVSDSEVDEVTGAGYNDVNLWQITRAGVVDDTGTTFTPAPNFSEEPTGLGYIASTNTLLVSDDHLDRIWFDDPGTDLRFGTADDNLTYMTTQPLGGLFSIDDVEDPEFDPATGHLFLLDGIGAEVYEVDPKNGTFGDGDDVVTHFDVGVYGPTDVEGLSLDPSRGTLLVGVRSPDALILEVTKTGDLVRTIDPSGIAGLNKVSGLAFGPASDSSGDMHYWITERGVDNGVDPTENDGEIYEVAAPGGNTAPVLDAIGNKSVDEGTNLTFKATATDYDVPPQSLTFSLASAPTGATINTSTGRFNWTPSEAQGPGNYPFDVCVSDGSLSDCETITVAVAEVNVAPTLNPIGNKSVGEDIQLAFTATASDPDLPANTLTFSLKNGTSGHVPTGASIGATSGNFTWTPTHAQIGAATFDVCVSDAVLSDCETITVTVNAIALNAPMDADGSGTTDLVWHQVRKGSNRVWLMDGATVVANEKIAARLNPDKWQPVGTGDFNDDGYSADLMWRNTVTGANRIWLMDGSTVLANEATKKTSNPKMRVVGTGDADANGTTDVLWRNVSTGAMRIWLMDGSTVKTDHKIAASLSLQWKPVGTGDFDGTGRSADIVWRNSITGGNRVWLLDTWTVVANKALPKLADPKWQLGGTGDADANGTSDLIWHHTKSGDNRVWFMNGTSVSSKKNINVTLARRWKLAAIGDLGDDGHSADLVWRNAKTGDNRVWQLDGSTVLSDEPTDTLANLNWEIVG